MRALWIEDHQLIGDSLEVLLQVLMPDVTLDKARTVDAAVQLAHSFPYAFVLMDWWIGDTGGEATIRALREAHCLGPFIVVSADEREPTRRRAMAMKVSAFVTKNTDPQSLVAAIRHAQEGGANAGSAQAAWVRRGPVDRFNKLTEPGAPLPTLSLQDVFPELTPRQADVFHGLMRGLADKCIARELAISETTVKTHVRAILQLVGANKRGEAAYQAHARGAGER